MHRKQARRTGEAAVPTNKSLEKPSRAWTIYPAKQNRTGLPGYKMTQATKPHKPANVPVRPLKFETVLLCDFPWSE